MQFPKVEQKHTKYKEDIGTVAENDVPSLEDKVHAVIRLLCCLSRLQE